MDSFDSIEDVTYVYEQLAKHLPLAVAVFDTEMQYLFVSNRWMRDYQLEGQDIIGRSHYEVFPEISREWQTIHQQCLLGHIHHDDAVPFKRLNGTTEWISREMRPWMYRDGQIGGLILYTEIITERKKAQDELRRQHQFLRQVIDLNTSFVFAKDKDGYFTLVNQSLADAYGSTVDEMVGKLDINFNPNQQEVVKIRRDDLEVLRSRKPKFIAEEPVTHANGETQWYQTIKIPLVLSENDDVQLLGIATDITYRKHVQEQLEKLVVQEQEARQAAETANQTKDLLLANMSHELRTPLNAIIGFLREMLYSQQLNNDNQHMAERCMANSKRLEILINSVLDLSRLAVGSLELVITEVDLSELATTTLNDLQIQAKEKGITLHLKFSEQLPTIVYHDEERLRQIISNLMVNGIKYTQVGSVTLGLEIVSDKLIIFVTDTGIGIAPDFYSAIFDDFVQVTNDHRTSGVGLGLSIVKNLVELMDGYIELESEINKYTTFKITLPLDLGYAESDS